jgi:FkbM family methyltransferase
MNDIHPLVCRAGIAQAIVHESREHMQAAWVRGEFFEQRMLEYIYWHYVGGVFVDVGAALGNHSLFFASFCAPKCVIAIEPRAESCERQRALYELNGVGKRVHVYNCAASDKPGKGAIEHFGPNLGQFRLCAFTETGFIDPPGREIEVTTLDAIVAQEQARPVRVVKIDVEGHELHVLRGAEVLLTEQHPALFIEIRSRQRYAAVTKYLARFGYRQVGSVFMDATAFEFAVG